MKKILFNISSFYSTELIHEMSVNYPDIHIAVNTNGSKLSPEEIMSRMDSDVIAILAGTEKYNRDMLAKATNLSVISRCGIGVDNIDLQAADDFHIRVVNTPDAPTVAVAELTVGLILMLLRKIPDNIAVAQKKNWEKCIGRLLSAQTVGLIGFGRIGRAVTAILLGFGCRVLAFDPLEIKHVAVEQMTLENLLKQSDVVSLHCPVTPETIGLIDVQALSLMKPTAYLVNTARGELIDESALEAALRQNKIQGAALDVFHQEPYSGSLQELQNVILTPHIGSCALETRLDMEKQAVDNLLANLAITNQSKIGLEDYV